MGGSLIFYLQVVKPFALVESICIVGTSSIWSGMLCAIVAALRVLVWIVVGVVYKALFLEEILATSIPCFIHFSLFLVESVVLDIYLTLIIAHVLLHHSYKAHKLGPFYLLWVKVVSFRYVEMRYNIVGRLAQ